MPNWRDPSEYKYSAKLGLPAWAWEFLRRNNDYRREWEAAVLLFKGFAEEHGEEAARHKFCTRTTDPYRPEFIISGAALRKDLRERWGLGGYVNPHSRRQFRSPFSMSHLSLSVAVAPRSYSGNPPERQATSEVRTIGHPWDAIVRVDLRYPLKPQIERLDKSLRFSQAMYHREAGTKVRRLRRPRQRWTDYLRVLDARLAGATYEEIADTLFPADKLGADADPLKKTSNLLEQARRMTKPEHYLKLLLPA